MKCLFAISLATTALMAPYHRAVAFQDVTPLNVNSRYEIEEISLVSKAVKLSQAMEREIRKLRGMPFRTELLDRLEYRIRAEFPGFRVTRQVTRGSAQDKVRVDFLVERSQRVIDLNSPRFLYHSSNQYSFGAGVDLRVREAGLSMGLITDNDERVERYSGIRGAVGLPVGAWRLNLLGESYRAQWRGENDEFYRTRQTVEPTVELLVAPGLVWRAGLSFNQMEFQFPAARVQSANAVLTTLRYTKQLATGFAGSQMLEAGYSLRAATTGLGSDFSYQQHRFDGRLVWGENAKRRVAISGQGGVINGTAPVLDRFVLGNSRTLRGWNRFELAPNGASRMVHFSADGRWDFLRLVYDSGTLWQEGRPKVLRHSAGLGFVVSGITAMVAIPIRNGSIEPIFLLGMNF